VVELDGKVKLQYIDFVTCRLFMQGTMQLLPVCIGLHTECIAWARGWTWGLIPLPFV